VKVWTLRYNAFVMGGKTDQPVETDVEPIHRFKRRGFEFAVFQNPVTTHFHVAEVSTGGFVGFGHTQELAIADLVGNIKGVRRETLQEQLRRGAQEGRGAVSLTPEDFWKSFRRR